MYPDLSYLLHDLIGTNVDNGFSLIKTFGFVLALAFLASRYFFGKELVRKEKQGLLKPSKEKVSLGFPATPLEILMNGIIGFFIGYKVVYLFSHHQEIGSDILPFIASTQGNMSGGLVGGLLFGVLQWYGKYREKLEKPIVKEMDIYPHQRNTDITIRAAISGILGAKLFAIFESTENIKAFFEILSDNFFRVVVWQSMVASLWPLFMFIGTYKRRV